MHVIQTKGIGRVALNQRRPAQECIGKDELISVREVARLLGVNQRTVGKYRERGLLAARRRRGALREPAKWGSPASPRPATSSRGFLRGS